MWEREWFNDYNELIQYMNYHMILPEHVGGIQKGDRLIILIYYKEGK